MSTNCIRCVKNKRTGGDLLCDECREISRHFDGCPARDGKPVCTCGGCRAPAKTTPEQPAPPETVGTEAVGSKELLAGGAAKWVSEGTQPLWAGQGWRLHRRNKTSGKSRGGIVASNMGEYAVKTTANDANAGDSCFKYKVVSPTGEIFHLEKPANVRLTDAGH